MDTLWQDLRFGARFLLRNPGVTLVAGLTLALGIGLTSTIFSVVSAVLLRPLPYADEDRIVMLFEKRPQENAWTNPVSPADFLDWREAKDAFEQVAAFTDASADLSDGGEPERLASAQVSWSFFDVLGVTSQAGRLFRPEDESEAGQYVVVLSDGLWRRRFGSSPDIVGRQIRLSGRPHTVVGVLPAAFRFPQAEVELWLPFAIPPGLAQVRAAHFLTVLARLQPGVPLERARAFMETLGARMEHDHPRENRGHYPNVMPLRASLARGPRDTLVLLLGAVGLLLLIAAANVANLLLARGLGRSREMAIRAALGAGHARIARLLLTESVLLSTVAGAAGLGLSVWGAALLRWRVPAGFIAPGFGDFEPDLRVAVFATVLSIATGFLLGFAPALQATRIRLGDALKESATAVLVGHRHRMRAVLLLSQIALALVLLVGSGLLMRSFLQLQRVSPGFRQPENVLAAQMVVPRNRYGTDVQVAGFYRDLLSRLATVPGVEATGAISQLPLSGQDNRTGIEIEGWTGGTEPTRAHDRTVAPGYFKAMGVPLLDGRLLEEGDDSSRPLVVLANRTMARRYWPTDRAVGKRIRLGGTNEWREVVGVVEDVKHWGLDGEGRPEMYLPLAQRPTPFMSLVLRSRIPPSELMGAVRERLRSLDPDLPLSDVRTLETVLAASVAPRRFYSTLLGTFATLALGLAGVGIASVVAFSVAERKREIGIRMAIGAEPGDVLRLVLGQGLRLTLAGVGLGLLAAIGLTRFLRAALYGVTSTDPLTYALVAALLTLVALVAAWVPARNAARFDPLTALRSD
jgi:putative ABC transport system permease protein